MQTAAEQAPVELALGQVADERSNRKGAVRRIKAYQRASKANNAAWRVFSDAYGFSDPQRHELDTLQDFILQHAVP